MSKPARWNPERETSVHSDRQWSGEGSQRDRWVASVSDLTEQFRKNPKGHNREALKEMRGKLNFIIDDRDGYFAYEIGRNADLVIGRLDSEKDRLASHDAGRYAGKFAVAKAIYCPPNPTSSEAFLLYLEAILPTEDRLAYGGAGVYLPLREHEIVEGNVEFKTRNQLPANIFNPQDLRYQ